jgi:hypothetical protein
VQTEADTEVHVLGGAQRFIEAAERAVQGGPDDQVGADQTGIAGEESVGHQSVRGALAGPLAAVVVAVQQVGAQHIEGIRLDVAHGCAQVRRQPLVIVVEERQQRSACQRRSGIARAARTLAARVGDHARGARGEPLNRAARFCRGARRTIIDDDDLVRQPLLAAHRLQRALEEDGSVAGRDDDADPRHTPGWFLRASSALAAASSATASSGCAPRAASA